MRHPDRNRIAEILFAVADRLELIEETPFRGRAFRRAARAMERLEGDLAELIPGGGLSRVDGIGPAIGGEIDRIWRTGESALLAELRRGLPDGLEELLGVPGLGPARLRRLHRSLGVSTLEGLEAACRAGRVAAVKGFGARTQMRILNGALQVRGWRGKILLSEADRIASAAREIAASLPGVTRVEPAGAVRRREEVVGRVDLLIGAGDAGGGVRGAVEEAMRGLQPPPGGVGLRLLFATPDDFPLRLLRATGPEEHLRLLAARADRRGVSLGGAASEEAIYRRLGLEPIPPELRSGATDLEAAAARVPGLIRLADLRGTFHAHTTWSDGSASIEAMAAAAASLGLEYLGISDHSRSARIANGLSPEGLLRQIEAIDRWNAAGTAPRLLKGSEVDILEDGRLDFPDDLLDRLDFVIGSVHSRFSMGREAMTRRTVKAMENPRLTMLGHPTGRLLLAREPFEIDLGEVVRAAARRGVAVEINANPRRLDVEPAVARCAARLGVLLVINPDAHSPDAISDLRYGVTLARKAGLRPGQVLNCRPPERLGGKDGDRVRTGCRRSRAGGSRSARPSG